MYASPVYNVGAALVTVGVGLLLCTLLISALEAIVMLLTKWDKFGKSVWVSLLMNVISTIFGMGTAMVSSFGFFTKSSIWLAVVIAFVLSVFIEGVILLLVKRGAARLNWLVSLAANSTSYLFIIVPLAWRIAW